MTAPELEGLDVDADELEDGDEVYAAVPREVRSQTYVQPERDPLETEWTWEGRLPRGHVVLIAGKRASAKGLLACNLAGHVTTGDAFPGELAARAPGDVVMVTAEDDANEDMAWRLRAAGADLARVHDLTWLPDGNPFELSAAATVPGHAGELLAYLRMLREAGRNPRLVILDPLNALVMHGTIKTDQGARRVISRLEYVAKRTGVTIVVIHHFVKDGSIAGSQGLEDAPRWVYTIEPDPDAPDYRVFHLHKCNVAVAEDLRYQIVSDGHDSRITWVDREDIRLEEHSWRVPKPTVVETPGMGSVKRWLSETGGGTPAECARYTGYDEALCRDLLERLKFDGLVGTRRRPKWPFAR